MEENRFYDLSANKPNGEEYNFKNLEGKAVLIVNTATQCGLTPQFTGLEKLHQEYKDKGLVVLGFPCNQFLSQEPLENENMEETCLVNHGVTFQLMEKTMVNGSDTNSVFKYLKEALPGTFSKRIKWNFTKFLISPKGEPIKRYAPKTTPDKIEGDIKKLLGEKIGV